MLANERRFICCRMVVLHVLMSGDKLKIFEAVVIFDLVLVMDNLIGR